MAQASHAVEYRGRCVFAVLSFILNLFLARVSSASQGDIEGVLEGQKIFLSPQQVSTNLFIQARPAEPNPNQAWELLLEHQGRTVFRRTSALPLVFTLTNLAAGKYFLAIAPAGEAQGIDVAFDILASKNEPPNDDWSEAQEILVLGDAYTARTDYATKQTGEPDHAGIAIGRSVWWKWKAKANAQITASTLESDFDTVLAVYSGAALDSLTLIAQNDDCGSMPSSQITFLARGETEYYFAVDGAAPSLKTIPSGYVQFRLLNVSPILIRRTVPDDGALLRINSGMHAENVEAAIELEPAGEIEKVEALLSGPDMDDRTLDATASLGWRFEDLGVGDYVLSWSVVSRQGLITSKNISFSIVPNGPRIAFDEMAGMNSHSIPLIISGEPGKATVLEASTNLLDWATLSKWTNFGGVRRFSDSNAAASSKRFYRAVNP